MPIVSVVNLVTLIRQHRLLEPTQLDELVRTLAPRFPEPRSLAKELIQRDWLTPYQINQLFQDRGDDLVLNSYVLLERLGEGGMGQVFKARNRLGQIVALKIIRRDRHASAESIHRFKREIKTASTLDHPNIVRALDADEADGADFFVMEYVEGTDLSKLVKQQGPLLPEQAAEYIRQAALGLQHAHEKGLVHRDIKPANLLLTRQGVIKVVDMGLACRDRFDEATPWTALTRDGAVVGTPDYIAPEQARNSRTVDIRCDLYSLGCTFYFLLTGQPPFPGGALTEKLLKHQLDPPPPLTEFRSDVPSNLIRVIEHLLAKRPADRYQTPGELAAALANGAAPPAPKTKGSRATMRPRRPSKRPSPSDFGGQSTPIAIPVATPVPGDSGNVPMATPVTHASGADLNTPFAVSVTRPVVARSPDRATASDRRSPRVAGDLRSGECHGQETVPQRGLRRWWLLVVAAILLSVFAVFGGVGAMMFLTTSKPSDEITTPSKDKDATEKEKDKDKEKNKSPKLLDWWQAREALAKRGARFVPAVYDPDHPITSVDLSGSTTVADADLAKLVAFPHLTHLRLAGTKITDKGLVHLASLKNVTSLWLSNTAVTDEGLVHLKAMTDLQELNLSATQVRGSGLVHVQGAAKLKVLNLSFSKINDAGLAPLAAMRQLEQLYLQLHPANAKQITNAGMVYLNGLAKLKQLSLRDTAVTDEGLRQLKDVGLLTILDLTNLKVSDAGLSGFKSLIRLQEFQASGTNVGDKGLPALLKAAKLQIVVLTGTHVKDSALSSFANKADLHTLSLGGTLVSNEGLKLLVDLPKLRSLDLTKTTVTDEGLIHLKGLKELQSLWLTSTQVRGPGLAELKGLSKLTALYLNETPLDDAGLKSVGELTPLTTLWLSSCYNITDGGTAHLKGLKSLKVLYLDKTLISDKTLIELKELKTLTYLNLSGTKPRVTEAGVEDLKKALPKLIVIY